MRNRAPARLQDRQVPLWQAAFLAAARAASRQLALRRRGRAARVTAILPARTGKLGRDIAAEVAVFLLIGALLPIVMHHATVAQLTPPAPPAAVCGNSAILNGPSSAPGGAVTVPAGDNSALFATQLPANTTYWFATGTHTVGSGEFSQIGPGSNDIFTGAPGAVISGQGLNNYAFGGNVPGVTIEYLTIEDFKPPGDQGAVNASVAPGWTMEYNTFTDIVPGTALYAGTDNTVDWNCITANGQQGFGTFTTVDVSPVTKGAVNVNVDDNEISYNNTCNWEAVVSFPITPPAGCAGAGQFSGCGCSGGGKFWQTDGGSFDDNYVHDNYSVGVWWDTNNAGFQIEGNYISGNFAVGLQYEISYNALIENNVFAGNAWGVGPLNPGFPSGAIYISESGSDSRIPGPYGTTFAIINNQFYDNWGGVVLWEDADRYCDSPAGSQNTCTIVSPNANLLTCGAPYPVPPSSPVKPVLLPAAKGRTGQLPVPAPGTGAGGGSAAGQRFTHLINYQPYYSDCRWKTQNIQVSGNLFDFARNDIGPSCTVANWCGFNGVFSLFGTLPPYLGNVIENAVTFSQDNLFSSNTYCGPWMFDALSQGNQFSYATWQGAPYGQDPGSSLNGPSCTVLPRIGPPRAPAPQPVQVPIFAGRR